MREWQVKTEIFNVVQIKCSDRPTGPKPGIVNPSAALKAVQKKLWRYQWDKFKKDIYSFELCKYTHDSIMCKCACSFSSIVNIQGAVLISSGTLPPIPWM